MFTTRLLLRMRKLLKYAGMTIICYFGKHWPYVTRLWCSFCLLIECPSTYLRNISEESFDCILIRFQNTTPVSLPHKLFICYLSQYSKVQHYLYQLAFRSHFCVLFPNPTTMSNVFLIPTSKFSVQHPTWIPSNLRWILFFVQGTSVGGFFLLQIISYLLSFNYQCSEDW